MTELNRVKCVCFPRPVPPPRRPGRSRLDLITSKTFVSSFVGVLQAARGDTVRRT